jgi:hypothetical protein
MKKFYMVYVEGRQSPTHKHEQFESAHREAERLTRSTRQKAYVLEAISSCHMTDILYEGAVPIPF